MSMAPTLSPGPLVSAGQTLGPAFRPTLAPAACPTLLPTRAARLTETPSTQRSATTHPRLELATTRMEARSLVDELRATLGHLEALLGDALPPGAHEAVRDLHSTLEYLDRRVALPRSR
jgi:hypothetical protein